MLATGWLAKQVSFVKNLLLIPYVLFVRRRAKLSSTFCFVVHGPGKLLGLVADWLFGVLDHPISSVDGWVADCLYGVLGLGD